MTRAYPDDERPTAESTAAPNRARPESSDGAGASGGLGETPVALRAHHVAVGRGMVVPAEQRPGQIAPGLLEAFELGIEHLETPVRDELPLGGAGGAEDPVDVVEREPRVLQHADEHQPAQRLGPVAALTR